jgi:hypothetical protein
MAFAIQDGYIGTTDLYTPDNVGNGVFSLLGTNAGKMGRYVYGSMIVDGVDPILGGGQFIYAQVAPIAAQSVSSLTISGNTATLTTGSAHGLSVGAVISLAGFTPSGYNGLFTVATVPSTTTLTFNASLFTPANYNPANAALVPLVTNANLPTGNATVMGTYVPGIGAGQVVQFAHGVESQSGALVLRATPWLGTANSGVSIGVALSNPLATTTSSVPSNTFGGQYAWFQISGNMVCYTGGAPAAGNQCYWNNAGGSGVGGALQPSAVASKQAAGIQYATAVSQVLGVSGTAGAVTLPSNMAVVWGTFPVAQGAIT